MSLTCTLTESPFAGRRPLARKIGLDAADGFGHRQGALHPDDAVVGLDPGIGRGGRCPEEREQRKRTKVRKAQKCCIVACDSPVADFGEQDRYRRMEYEMPACSRVDSEALSRHDAPRLSNRLGNGISTGSRSVL
jgi:hypothetical protein